MKKIIKAICVILTVLILPAAALGAVAASDLPDSFRVVEGRSFELEADVPLTASPSGESVLAEAGAGAREKEYQAQINMFGMIPIKTVNVQVMENTKVIPCGTPFGIKLFAEGVLVVGMTDVDSAVGNVNPGVDAGLRADDLILSIDGEKINENERAAELFERSQGREMTLEVRRGEKVFEAKIRPVLSQSANTYKAGLWIRDSSAGIGTMTFYMPESGIFGGLGHGVCDIDTGGLMPMQSGEMMDVNLIGITKGAKGAPGELRGCFASDTAVGELFENTQTGVYGSAAQPVEHEAVSVAMKQEVKKGKAQILTTIQGEVPAAYEIEITKVNYDPDSPTQNMVIHITDERLLQETGGIVQGMSGSPILQNGKLVGAVTHVFVNDPTKGYGIFAENMLAEAQNVANSQNKKAA